MSYSDKPSEKKAKKPGHNLLDKILKENDKVVSSNIDLCKDLAESLREKKHKAA